MCRFSKKIIVQQILLLSIAVFAGADAAFSQSSNGPPSGTAFTLKKLENDKSVIDKMIEPSGVVPIRTGKYLLVANDKDDTKGNSLTIVEAKTGMIVKTLENIQGNDKNPKWEAMAKDSDNYYYAIGSHSVDKGDSAKKLEVRSRIFRFKLVNEDVTKPDEFSIGIAKPGYAGTVSEFEIKTSLTKLGIYDANRKETDDDPKKKKAKIEGLAVRTLNGVKQLVIGLRQPLDTADRTQVYVADLPKENEIKPLNPLMLSLLFQFNAGRPKDSPEPFRLSSIEYVSELKGFLILTSTEGAGNSFYGNAMWFVSDEDIEKSRVPNTKFKLEPRQITIFEPTMKAEGIAVLPSAENGKMRLVIVYDNDPQNTQAPSKMQCVEMSANHKITNIDC